MSEPTEVTESTENIETPPPSRDAGFWSPTVSKLEVGELPSEAVNRNVQGRRVTSPIQGFGKMWQKTYRVTIPGADVSPQRVIATWKEKFPEFWPKGNNFYGPITGIAPGDVAVLNLTMGGLKLSTGVLVMYADDESFTLMTPEGHMFAGWITFSAYEDPEGTVAQAQVLMRASDPLYEVGLTLGGHKKEDKFWESTLTSLATYFGAWEPTIDTQMTCVDKKRQWSSARNVRNNSAIRSSAYMAGAPFRAAAKPFKKKSST
jgi:hypothetical protein